MSARILVVLPTIGQSGGGVTEVARLYTKYWADYCNVSVDVVALHTSETDETLPEWLPVRVFTFKSFGPARFGASPAMLRFLLTNDYDVVHVHGLWMFHNLAVLLWSLRFRRPYLITTHGMLETWILRRSRILKFWVSIFFQNKFLRNASFIHTLNPKESEDVLNIVPKAKIAEIPNFVPEILKPTERPVWWESKFEERRVLLFLGRIHDKKGWLELLKAWDSVCANDKDFCAKHQLVFCGWNDGAVGFENEVERQQTLHGNVIFAGPQFGQEKYRSYSSADMFILPSKSEGLPMTVLEAWSFGCPVMMTSACNLNIGFEQNAAIQIGESFEELKIALFQFARISDISLHRLSENARQLHRTNFSQEECGSKLLGKLNETVEIQQASLEQ